MSDHTGCLFVVNISWRNIIYCSYSQVFDLKRRSVNTSLFSSAEQAKPGLLSILLDKIFVLSLALNLCEIGN